jgi:two-component system, LytTR family, sensor kinase
LLQSRRKEPHAANFELGYPEMSASSGLAPWRRFRALPLFWRLQIAGWIAFAVLSLPVKAPFLGAQNAILVTVFREPLGFLLTLGLRWVFLRLRLTTARPLLVALCVVPASLTAAAVDILVLAFLPVPTASGAQGTMAAFWFRGIVYLTWSLMYFLIRQVMETRERELTLARAESAAHQAELQVLRAQVDPHFLFNALNTVLAGLDRDPRGLTPVVQGLADYLRYSLVNRHATFVPLGDEYDATMNYLVVEKARFREGLVIDARVDEAVRSLPVPVVIIQPLVENAVKHGLKSSPLPLRIRVHVTSAPEGGADVEVANTGRWIEPPAERPRGDASGAGLELVRRRLELLYAGTHGFHIDAKEHEVAIRLRLPVPSPALLPSA